MCLIDKKQNKTKNKKNKKTWSHVQAVPVLMVFGSILHSMKEEEDSLPHWPLGDLNMILKM